MLQLLSFLICISSQIVVACSLYQKLQGSQHLATAMQLCVTVALDAEMRIPVQHMYKLSTG